MPSKTKAPAPARGTGLTLSVGLVNVPVKIAPLVKSTAVGGKRICSCHQEPVKQQNVCQVTGAAAEGIETAFEYDGKLVTGVDRSDFKSKRDGTLALSATVELSSLDPLYFEKSYVVWPQDGQEGAYDLIAYTLRETGKALVGQTVLTTSTRVVAIRWSEATETLVAHVLTYDENVGWNDVGLVAAAIKARKTEIGDKQYELARQLLASLDADVDLGEVTDEYNERLVGAIEAAAKGMPAPVLEDEPDVEPIGDLMAALQASVDASAKPKAKARKKVAA